MKLQAHAAKLTGIRIGKLVVQEPVRRERRGVFWRCVCDCGNTTYEAAAGDLRSGRITSCGCYRNSQGFADSKVIHGHSRKNKGTTSRTYNAWCDMKKRCDTPSSSNYQWYGGKGISYDPRWASFEWFYAFVGDCPEGHELHRPDSTKDYGPNNWQWIEGHEHAKMPKPRHES